MSKNDSMNSETAPSIIDRLRIWPRRAEYTVGALSLLLIALLPAAEAFARIFKSGVHASNEYIRHLTLWVTFIGGALAARGGRHLTIQALHNQLPRTARVWACFYTTAVSSAVCLILAWSSFTFLRFAFDPSRTIGFVPIQIAFGIVPAGFLLIAIHGAMHSDMALPHRIAAGVAGLIAPLLLGGPLSELIPALVWPLAIALFAAALLGAPIFVILGGFALLLFAADFNPVAVVANEAYTMLTDAIIPTIPLFTFAGFILSESKAGERLVALFRAAFGWMPGGSAIMAIIVCAFFTTFTGASGVTILALGGLLSYVLLESGYSKKFSSGLLTASGSIGLLFPPSLPIILYGVIAHVNIKKLFVAGFVPGILMIAVLALFGVSAGTRQNATRQPFDLRVFFRALRDSAWELSIPIGVLILFFGGIATLVETAAITVLIALGIESIVHRDLGVRDLFRIARECLPVIGGVLVILAVARGLSYYIVDARVPVALTEWAQTHVHSKYVFLLLLNIALLIAGCFMDIFSAIMVIVPLILPIGAAFDIDPIHLGVIFLANLELGYLTPPVGINLFLASFRFKQPLTRVYRSIIPYLLALLAAVLIITYVPALTLGPVHAFFK